MREKKPGLASFVLIGLILASILAGAASGASVGGAEDETEYINITDADLPSTSFPNSQTPLPFMPNDNSLSSKIVDDKTVFLFSTSSTTVTLTPVADATIDYISPNTNFGAQDTLEVQYRSSRHIRRILLRFNLAAAVPSNAIIDLARLDLYLEGSQGPDSISLVAARLTEDWIESLVTWNNRPATGDPVEATLVDTTVSPVRVDVTDIVRAWHNVPHYGLELWGPEGETVYNLIFESREHREMLPQLAVTYHLPSLTYTFTGNVYQGSPPDTDTPAGGVTVELWGDEDEWPEAGSERVRLSSTTTDDAGAFSLSWEMGEARYPYLHVIELDPPGTYSTGAQAGEPGYVKNFNVVSYLDIPPGTYDGIAFWDQLPEEKPDLVITEIWNEEGRICYHIQNIGEAVAPAGHCTALSVDDAHQVEDCVEEDLAPGAGLTRCFEYGWECTPPEDVIVVCADHRGDIEEREEENNCMERIFECVPEEKPDLVITDVWNEDSTICYQIRNTGEAVATKGHYTALFVDGNYRVSDWVDVALEPGERWKGCFDYDWECTSPEDIIVAVADYENSITESNETNNRREELWKCDTTAPKIISGPIVQNVTQDSAVIFWETNEDSDSEVKYGKMARMYALEETDPALVREHIITLLELEPSTTYNFVVQSTDARGNTVKSKDKTFETLPLPDDEDPTVSIIDPGICQGTITIYAEAEDNIRVEKVEFFFGETLVYTDFLEEQSYRLPKFPLDTYDYENGGYTLKAKAYDLSGRFSIDERAIEIVNVIDVTAPQVNIYHPSNGATVSGEQGVCVVVEDDTGVSKIEFFVDGKKISGYNYLTTPTKVDFGPHNSFWWDTRFLQNGDYTFGVKATDEDGKTGVDTVYVHVSNLAPPLRPKLVITKHNITRHKNYFGIDLWVKNEGTAKATTITIKDSLRAFQPISKKVGSVDYNAEFDPATWEGNCIINDTLDLDPGQSRYYTFKAVPVLIHKNPPKPSIGDSIKLTYEGPYGTKYSPKPVSFTIKETTLNYPNVPIATAYNDALKEADYLIVTNRPWLILCNLFQLDDVNALLSDMAHLATLRNGVLGYFSSPYVSRDTIRDLIKPGGDWAKRLHPDFSKPLKGYLLIVGETEIVPAWHPVTTIEDSDHPYSDTTGDGVPDLIVGRIIGDDAANLTKPIQASIGVFEKSSGYAFDRKKALMISGPGGGVGSFVKSAQNVGATLKGQKFSVGYLHMTDYFPVPLKSFSRDYQQEDGFAVGDVLGDTKDEIVIGDASANKIAIYSPTGTLIYEFSRVFDDGDALATGDIMGYGKDQIVQADKSHDRIYITQIQGTAGSFSAVVVHSIDASFDKDDRLAVGDVMGDAREEALISDISLDKIFIRRMDATMWSWFDYYGLEKYDLFAVGDVMGNAKEEIVIADQSANEMFVFNSSGPPALASLKFHEVNVKGQKQKVKWLVAMGEGAALAVGNVQWCGKDEIVIGAPKHSEHIHSYWWYAKGKKLLETGGIPFDFGKFDGLATGGNNEVFVGDRDGVIRTFDAVNVCTRAHNALPGLTQNVDVIYWHGHGNAGSWPGACIYSSTARAMDFNNHNPFIMTASCSTGSYERGAIAESFLASGAAVYIGSTEDTIWTSREFAQTFFKNWAANESIGEVFTDLEKSKWSQDGVWKDYVRMHNLYGDPKYGKVASVAQRSTLAEPPLPLPSLQVEIPNYVVTTIDGLEYVEIPGGHVWYEAGEPWVPFYSTSIDYPAGYKVQEVYLVEKSGLATDTNLSIPMSPLNITPSTYVPVPCCGPLEDWFPEEEYHWEIVDNPDGTSTLVITMYPIYYNPQTTDVRFYKNYNFDINYTVSPVAITSMTTDKNAYQQDDTVKVDIGLNNSGEAQDVIVSASVKQYGSDEVVDGLLLSTLKEFKGLASFSPQWESSGFEPGYYYVEVTLKDTAGNLLDSETQMFRLGISSGEITNFTATPEYFDIGDAVDINMTFNSTGTVDITGTAITKIKNSTGYVAEEFRHNVTDLMPSESISFGDTWDTSGAEEGSYNIIGYVLYDSKATEPVTVTICSGVIPCVTPKDDLYINLDTTLCPGVYNIPDSGAEGVIIINASNVVLDCNGAIINGTMTGSDYGIYSRDYDNVTIKNCNMMNYQHGIELEMSSNSTITHNDLSLNRYGIYLFYSDDSIVTNNNANSNNYKGIGLASSSNNLVTNNNANKNEDGIFLGPRSSNNKIEGNNASSNKQAGIYIYGDSSSNIFSNNEINDNLYGIYLSPCICPTCSHYCPGGNFNNTIKVNKILNNEIGIFSNQSTSMIGM
jgi:parallel beta-helix repeat protein